MRSSTPPRLNRVIPLMLAFGLIVGPGATWLGDEVDRGHAELGAFSFALACLGLVCRPFANEIQEAVFAIPHGPWLGGRLKRWQRLLLPYSSALYLTQGLTLAFGGSSYLLTASPGFTAINAIAIGFTLAGGALIGFALGRLLGGIVVIRSAGNWSAPGWSWALAGALVVGLSLASAARALTIAMEFSSVV